MLELCANKISDISALSTHPPLLVHLGLGYNNISFIGDYITGDIWPSLLSLDLSNNNLTDLLDVVQKFSTLPKLRYLVLTGNPLTLIPGYRGYIIDNLHCLTILDDIRISADEKHHFKGLARRREYILDEAKVMLEVKYLKGLPVPEEVKNPDDQPEFPVIERLYFVQFMFPAEHSNQASIFHILHDDLEDIRTVSEHHDSALETSAIMGYSQTSEAHTPGGQPEIKRVNNLSSALPQESGVSAGISGEEEKIREGQEVTTGEHCLQLAPVNTDTKPWAEVIEMNWQTNLVRDDLIVLRDFFKQGMNISVIEQVVLCFPVEPECNACSPTSTKDKKTTSPPTKSDKKKKKETSPQELRREPPQLNTLASFHIPLTVFLDGEFEFSSVFTKQMDSTQSTPASDNSEDAKALRGSSKNTKKGKIKDDKKGKDKKPESKSKKNDSQLTSDEMSPTEPRLFEMQVAVRLHHWTTAVDSLKEKEEKNKAQEVENT
ncbi:leucine-rich repeat-containing protein 43-like isoform X2 [Pomacea canaliculata]|nr:leucine-rich repeat-containing protein 43-like isoform X2 [Pomacea canaliculata]